MADLDLDAILALLRDPNAESRQIAEAAGCPREEAGRGSRLVLGIARARPEEVLSLPGPLAAAAARAALGAGRADLLAALGAHPSRDAAKEAKRGLHVLKTRGVQVPEPARPAGPPPPAPATPEPPLPGYASAIDGQGERAVWLPRVLAGRGVEIAQAVLSDERGLVELQLGIVGRREWRLFAKGLLDRGTTMGIVDIDAGLALAMIASARALNDRAGQRVPPGADLWLGQLGPAAPLPDPAQTVPTLPDDEEREAVEQSGRLHDLPLLRGWLADEPLLRGVAATLDEIAVSTAYADDGARAARMEQVISDALAGWFDPDRTGRFAARLFAMAAHLQRAGDEAHARLAAASARALRRGVPPHRVPVARLLVQKAFPAAAPGAGLPSPGPRIAPPRAGPGPVV
jgi:hypothetical protein